MIASWNQKTKLWDVDGFIDTKIHVARIERVMQLHFKKSDEPILFIHDGHEITFEKNDNMDTLICHLALIKQGFVI